LPPSISHLVYTLIGFAWPVFGLVFLILLCSTDWFAVNVAQLFPLAVLFALAVGHCLAFVLESDLATRAAYFFKNGLPLIYYRRFALVFEPAAVVDDGQTDEPPACYGQAALLIGRRRVLFEAVDELYLTFLGTLEVRSFASCGQVFEKSEKERNEAVAQSVVNRPDVLVRIPLSILDLKEQKALVELFQKYSPALTMNDRLRDRLKSPIVKGQNLIQSLGAALLVFALCDVTFATFTWLEMLKGYYGAQMCMRHPQEAQVFQPGADPSARAKQLFDHSEQLRLHPSPYSWAYRALFANGNSQAQLLAIKAETLYRMGRKAEAVATLEEALTAKTSGFKAKLQLVRYLAEDGENKKAQAILDEILEKHKDVLLPRVYTEALLVNDDEKAVPATYEKYLQVLDEEAFGSEPAWPPGGEKPIMEMWKRDDLTFLAERLLLKKGGKGNPR
jgi:tetratricopeptide (TPR) repeat protein